MSKSKELDPRNLGISAILIRRTGVRVDIMVGQHELSILQEGLKLINDGAKFALDENDRALAARQINRGRWCLVSSLEEDGWSGRDENTRLVYGVFTSDGQVLPDPYACASLTGRYKNVQELFQQVTRLLS